VVSDCVVEISEIITPSAWVRLAGSKLFTDNLIAAFHTHALSQMPSGWSPQPEVEQRLLTTGMALILRATKKPETDSGDCDGSCEMCSRGRSSYVMTGVE
jgi:hypothetical protein